MVIIAHLFEMHNKKLRLFCDKMGGNAPAHLL